MPTQATYDPKNITLNIIETMNAKELTLQAELNRKRLVEIVYNGGAGHIGGDLSCLNVMTAL